ncbi:proton channel OtopLc-like [Lineus longissimus]|uniref:proton channel OtopLc-like n=1 Tax=Lineus longissimus TaxID=88925 RepID=UPI002B4E7F87
MEQRMCRQSYHSKHEKYDDFKWRQHHRPVGSKERSGLTRTLCGLYCMIMSVFGTVFPISDALSKTEGVHTYYTEIFHTFLYSVSVGMLAYLLFYLLRQRIDPNGDMQMSNTSPPRTPEFVPSDTKQRESVPNVSNLDQSVDQLTKITDSHDSEIWKQESHEQITDVATLPSKGPVCYNHDESCSEPLPPSLIGVTFDSEGLNFYLRLGAVGFGLGSMVHSGFKISEPFENPAAMRCRSIPFFVNALLYLILVFMQTFFIFKYHKVIINKHKPFVRMGLVHLIATNLAVWLSTTVNETVEDIGRVYAEERAELNNQTQQGAEVHVSNTTSFLQFDTIIGAHNQDTSCHDIHTLSDNSSGYLFPCLIEYSLIAAAVSYKTFQNVGRNVILNAEREERDVEMPEQIECHKSNLGLFAGLTMILLTLISIALFFVFQDYKHLKQVSAVIFLVSEIFLFLLGIFVSISGLIRTKRLHYVGQTEGSFDDKLLLVALFGNYALNTCIGLSSASHLMSGKHLGPEEHSHMISALFLVMASLNFIESTTQSMFILDGLRRCAKREEDIERKPGRSIITFLLVCNLAMWMINTFEMKKSKGAAVHVNFYNYLPWSIIMHLCLPLVILFRFHSSVCLSDIWQKAYVMVKQH